MINYKVFVISASVAKKYIRTHHYSKGSHNGPTLSIGLFDNGNLIGCCMFATPCSERVRCSLWGEELKESVIELHRLHIMDVTPRNTESWFISRCLKLLKKTKSSIYGVLSFADPTEGHTGTIYKATNAYRLGETVSKTFYRDQNGRLRHPRQNGVNIDTKAAAEKNWKPTKRKGKIRYLWLLPNDKKHKKILVSSCKYDLSTQKFN